MKDIKAMSWRGLDPESDVAGGKPRGKRLVHFQGKPVRYSPAIRLIKTNFDELMAASPQWRLRIPHPLPSFDGDIPEHLPLNSRAWLTHI